MELGCSDESTGIQDSPGVSAKDRVPPPDRWPGSWWPRPVDSVSSNPRTRMPTHPKPSPRHVPHPDPDSSQSRKPRLPTKEAQLVRLFAVAIGVSQGRKTAAIMEAVCASDSVVRRDRSLAKALNLYTVDWSKAPNAIIAEKARRLAHRSDVFDRLRALAGSRLKFYQCVIPGPAQVDEDLVSPAEWRARLARFAGEVAPHLLQELTNARTTLVTYGHTLANVFEATAFSSLGPDFAVYPACCDPHEYHHEPWSSSELARWITERQGRPTKAHPSLEGLLPIINPDYGLEARQALVSIMENAPDYRRIYGANGLAAQANCLVTSIGRSKLPWTMGEDYFVKIIGISRAELHSLIAAEIGSVPLPKPDLTADQVERFRQITAARLGLKLQHLEALVRKGACTPAPGVVVVAMGANKAACFLELVKRGLINVAIVDNSLEAKLLELLDGQLKAAA